MAHANIAPPDHYRSVRSYVRREGRLTSGQQRAIKTLWPKYGIELAKAPLNFEALFQRTAPVVLDIGFGDGCALLEIAQRSAEKDFVGIEIYRPGVGRLLRMLEEKGLRNVRVINDDAVPVFQHFIQDHTLTAVLLLFPDPWPKKRHHKRRLVQVPFVELLARKIHPGGWLHLATDWEDYAEHMLRVLQRSALFVNQSTIGRFCPRPDYRPITKFELRGKGLGHEVYDLSFRRC